MFDGFGQKFESFRQAISRIFHRVRLAFVGTWKKIPVLGHLAYCTKKNHAEAAKELSITLIFSTATIWMTMALLKAYTVNGPTPLLDLFVEAVGAGQLFIFAVTFLGPIYTIAGDDPENAKKFPDRGLHLVLISPLTLLGGGLYALQFSGRTHPGPFSLDSTYLLHFSEVVALIAVVLRYLTVVYRKSTMSFDPEESLIEPAQHFADTFAARHQK